MKRIRVCLFEDNKKMRDALSLVLRNSKDIEWCGSYTDCNNLLNDFRNSNADVVLMDIQMPGKSGTDAVKELKNNFPETPILMLSNFDDEENVFSSICNGASGYLLKKTSPAKIIEAILEVNSGGAPMTPIISRMVLQMFRNEKLIQVSGNEYHLSVREKEVLNCLVKGMSLKMVADSLFISYDTVRSHIKSIYKKLHVVSMTEAVAKTLNEKLLKF